MIKLTLQEEREGLEMSVVIICLGDLFALLSGLCPLSLPFTLFEIFQLPVHFAQPASNSMCCGLAMSCLRSFGERLHQLLNGWRYMT